MGTIALASYNRDKLQIAESAVAAAVNRAKSNEPVADFPLDHQRMLVELANALFEGGYGRAALMALQQAKELLEKDARGYEAYWRDPGEAAAQQGDLKMASETLEHLAPDERAYVQTEMQRAQAKMTNPTLSTKYRYDDACRLPEIRDAS